MKTIIGLSAAFLLSTTACADTSPSSQSNSDTTVTGGDRANDTADASMAADATPTEAMPFVAMAGASDLYEIQSSQLALEKSQTASVRDFAQMMIDHHTKTTQQVTAAAREAGLTPPPPKLMPVQSEMIAELKPLSGTEFDRAYLKQQVKAHEMALALHTNYAQNGDTPALKTAASGAAPIVQQHLNRVQPLATR